VVHDGSAVQEAVARRTAVHHHVGHLVEQRDAAHCGEDAPTPQPSRFGQRIAFHRAFFWSVIA